MIAINSFNNKDHTNLIKENCIVTKENSKATNQAKTPEEIRYRL